MRAEIYWLDGAWPGRLAVLPRPRAGDWIEEELRSLRQGGVDVLLSLLCPEEIRELGLAEEPSLAAGVGLEFLHFPIPDRGVPVSNRETAVLVQQLAGTLRDGRSLAIHCRQGVGRSALIAAALLTLFGEEVDAGLQRVAVARGCPVPDTAEQRQWLDCFVEKCLGPRAGSSHPVGEAVHG